MFSSPRLLRRCPYVCLFVRPFPANPSGFSFQLEKKTLQAQVVNSPQRIVREVSDLQQALEQVQQ